MKLAPPRSFSSMQIKTRWCHRQRLYSWMYCFRCELDFEKLLKFSLIIDGTYDDISNTGSSIKDHVSAALWVKMCCMENFSSYTHALPSKPHLTWCPAPNYNSSIYMLIHPVQWKDSTTVTYNEINDTLALVCKTPCNHILLEPYHPGKMPWMYAMWCKIAWW